MKIQIVTFSQTGNTHKVATAIIEAFEEAGLRVDGKPLKKAAPNLAGNCDLFGVGTPCFSSRTPKPVLDFLKKIPGLDGKPVFVFATSGGGPGRVLYDMTTALRKKGANVVGGILIRGECFHPFPAIAGRFPGRPDKQDLAVASNFARSLAEHVSSGRAGPIPFSRKDALKPGFGFYDIVAMINTDKSLRAALKAPQADKVLCDKCAWCAKECPVGNITMEPYPFLHQNCIRCYRCVSGCPKQAFIADIRVGNLLTHLFYNTFFERWLGDVKANEKFY